MFVQYYPDIGTFTLRALREFYRKSTSISLVLLVLLAFFLLLPLLDKQECRISFIYRT